MKELTASDGTKCIVSDKVYEWASKIKWNTGGTGKYFRHGQASSNETLHRMIVGDIPEGFEVDHIDRNPCNNLEENLRIVTHAENLQNNNGKNIYYDKWNGKWKAYIMRNGKRINLGYHKTKEEALEAVRIFKENE